MVNKALLIHLEASRLAVLESIYNNELRIAIDGILKLRKIPNQVEYLHELIINKVVDRDNQRRKI